jgi:hypothetical protein
VSKHRMAQLSALLTLVGSVLIFYAFQASSTGFLVYTHGKYGESSMCVGDPPKSLIAMGPSGELIIGTPRLNRECAQGKSFAVVNTESPLVAKVGWSLIVLGFVLQMFSVETLAAKAGRRQAKKI